MTKILKKEHIHFYLFFLLILISLAATGCRNKKLNKVPQYTYKVEAVFPHDAHAYTQGLFIHNGELYESTGQFGESTMRKVDMETGYALEIVRQPNNYFSEGACVLNGKIYQLTWQNRICFVYDLATFKQIGEFNYSGEGWGITTDGKQLLMSDGSSVIRFIDPDTFAETRVINVTYEGLSLSQLNELEYINGEIWANVYLQDYLVRIDPANGKVVGAVLLHGLLPNNMRTAQTDVLNGIAYDAVTKKIYVTGKYWPQLYQITIVPLPAK